MGRKTKVAIVDDNLAFLEGLSALIDSDDSFELVSKFTSGKSLLNFNKLSNIDLLLLDVEMPEMNGIETARLLNYNHPNIKIIAVTMYQDKVYLTQLIESGFLGFVNKTNVSDELFDTIDRIMKGELCFPESIN
ncbi:MAG TPA: response regulator transcription factor [Prolixibacteraceae bacterium]|nr:response regulator transcription factor [Prolixibacteraceae bacterium]